MSCPCVVLSVWAGEDGIAIFEPHVNNVSGESQKRVRVSHYRLSDIFKSPCARRRCARLNMRALQSRGPRPAAGGLAPTSTSHKHHELAELPLVQSREQTNPLRLSCRHHSIHTKIITCLSRTYGTSFSAPSVDRYFHSCVATRSSCPRRSVGRGVSSCAQALTIQPCHPPVLRARLSTAGDTKLDESAS